MSNHQLDLKETAQLFWLVMQDRYTDTWDEFEFGGYPYDLHDDGEGECCVYRTLEASTGHAHGRTTKTDVTMCLWHY